MLDTYPSDEVVKILIEEEAGAIKAAKAAAPEIARGSRVLAERLAAGGRLVFVGAGTAGRLAALAAAECVPQYGLPPSLVVPVLAGGPHAMARTSEISQDSRREAEQRMRKAAVGPGDIVCAVADGELSIFLVAALEYARFRRAQIVLVTCAEPPPAEDGGSLADVLVRLAPGPEVITGVSRAKAATAIKVGLQALVDAAFVQLGKTYGGLMVDVRPTTPRTWKRAIQIVGRLCHLDDAEAEKLIKKAGGRAKVALVMHHAKVTAARAKELLVQHRGSLRAIVGDLDLTG
ncbi:MAG: N-acetylmuramic acid 6-phosphate etherase [Deltaproteobacteria bacterium]|nr:N-acetylmuramic acid 6-phosphate etherase [Deltaproteobacteria bacterium]